MITARATIDERRALSILRAFDDGELLALIANSGELVRTLAERVIGERSHREALQHELTRARADAEAFERHVTDRRERLAKDPSGTERVVLEDELKLYEARLSGALDEVAAVEAELRR